MTQKYKAVGCNNKNCGDVGQWEVVLGENLTHHQASRMTMKESANYVHCWYCKQEVTNISNEEVATRIQWNIDNPTDIF